MAFRLEEFKKTTRKSSGGSVPASVYPHQIKDKKAIARLDIAIRTFDGSVGKRRQDMDAQAMTDFFGDPRLARGIVACLGQFYKYQTSDFPQMVGRNGAGRLREAGLSKPTDVRAYTYVHVNAEHHGFLTESGLALCYAELGERFCLTAHQWDTLLHLDAEGNQVLTRVGVMPTPADIVALYNFHSLDTALKRATTLTLCGLAPTAAEATEIRALARALGVKASVSGDQVTLTDLEMSSLLPRHLGRPSRCLLQLVQTYATRSTVGYADMLLGSRPFRLSLAADTLRVLGMTAGRDDEKPAFRRRFEAVHTLHKDWLKQRARSEGNGWRIKRLPDPVVTASGVLLPDFKLTRGSSLVYVLLGDSSSTPPELGAGGPSVLSFPLGRKPIEANDVLAQAEAATNSLFLLPPRPTPAVPNDVLALCDRAAASGMVRAADAQRTLHLLDESPLIEWVRQAADPRVRYIPGIGLCSQELVTAIQSNQILPLPV